MLKDTCHLSSARSFVPYLGANSLAQVVNCNGGKGNFQDNPIQIQPRDFLHTELSFYGCYRYSFQLY